MRSLADPCAQGMLPVQGGGAAVSNCYKSGTHDGVRILILAVAAVTLENVTSRRSQLAVAAAAAGAAAALALVAAM